MAAMHPTMSRLYLAAATKGISGQSELARKMNASPQRVNNWEARGISQEGANLAQASLGISSTWVLSGQGEMMVAGVADDQDWSDIQGAAQSAALGDGSLPDEYAETHKLKFRASSLRRKGLRPDALQVYYGAGDSMEPRIRDGDAIMFDTSDTRVVDGRIYVIRYEGHVYAKRLQVHDDLVFIESDNATDPKWRRPVLVRPGDDFEVVGRVRWLGSWED